MTSLMTAIFLAFGRRAWCFFGRHEPLWTLQRTPNGDIATPRVVIWVCQHCLRELGRYPVPSLPRVRMTPLKVERLRNLIRHINRAARVPAPPPRPSRDEDTGTGVL